MKLRTCTEKCVSCNNHVGLLGRVAHEMRLALKRENWDNFRARCSARLLMEIQRNERYRSRPSFSLSRSRGLAINKTLSLSLSKEKRRKKVGESSLTTACFAFIFGHPWHSFSNHSFYSPPRQKAPSVNRAYSFAPERPALRTHE